MIEVSRQGAQDAPAIETLLDIAFGTERLARPSYRLRDGIDAVAELGFVARRGGILVGTIRFWPLSISGAKSALLLGPIAVHPEHGNLGIGSRLIRRGLSAARARGDSAVAAIGAAQYLGRFGFRPAHEFALEFPAAVARDLFLALELQPGALDAAGGMIGRAGE